MNAYTPVTPDPYILKLDGITVDFDGFKAIDNFSMTLERGQLRVLIGPNGAGKSTLCDTIIGRVQSAAGTVTFNGADITNLPEFEIVRRGICRKFQTPGVLPSLTVRDNLLVSARRDRRWWKGLGHGAKREEAEKVEALLDKIGLTERAETFARDLAHGEKQWLEIGMVVATGAELLLLDEPTAGMGPNETSKTAKLIHSLLGDHAVLVIDHDMAFVEELGAKVTVMHQGKFLKQGSVADVRADPEVAAVYLGRAKE
ncbi:urea ABC transporter ATP-binding protein UrtD (plasmid) [Thioclava litoralis]|uniref:Urea ABC transporter ATP-binding protein UrtD n=1 Tax=Thioclava litoralis TaxID=3076557 RepID=A0ABZ1E5Z3_9RHOB|nr:urea ABC transporter ATP-binding protein UrtD [Thioclava sp. FTW29]